MIIVLAGTAEGRKTSFLLEQEGLPITVSAVSSYGADLLINNGSKDTIQGCLDKPKLVKLIKDKNIRFLVDGTHPFAEQISTLAMEIAVELDICYVRLERKSSLLPDDPLVTKIEALEQLEEYLLPQQMIFSTLGSKNLPLILPMIKRAGAHLIARVLPFSEVIKNCEDLSLNPDNIVALKGPFSKELNKHLFKHYGAQLVITKESGTLGGLDTKIEAALELEIPVVVWCRPKLNYPLMLNSPEEVVEYIRLKLGGFI